jgi:hypothetical protein
MVVCALGIRGVPQRRVGANQQLVCGLTKRLERGRFFGRLDGQQEFAVPEEHLAAAFQCAHENATQALALRLHPRAPLAGEKQTTGYVMRHG